MALTAWGLDCLHARSGGQRARAACVRHFLHMAGALSGPRQRGQRDLSGNLAANWSRVSSETVRMSLNDQLPSTTHEAPRRAKTVLEPRSPLQSTEGCSFKKTNKEINNRMPDAGVLTHTHAQTLALQNPTSHRDPGRRKGKQGESDRGQRLLRLDTWQDPKAAR